MQRRQNEQYHTTIESPLCVGRMGNYEDHIVIHIMISVTHHIWRQKASGAKGELKLPIGCRSPMRVEDSLQ